MTTPGRGDRSSGASSVAQHWDTLYATREPDQLSWTQTDAGMSARLIDGLELGADDPVVDVGGGAGVLVDYLLAAGHRRITVLDLSARALDIAGRRIEGAGYPPEAVEWTVADVLGWQASHRYRLWHDRAVFHFLTDAADRARYRERATAALEPNGYLVIGTFAEDGPTRCSGLSVCRYTPAELADQFAPDVDLLIAARDQHRTPWGGPQPFAWVVLRRRP
jgi:cyclopropane fatty-acyl-phospholipid synthase-like methyltransferase